MSRRAVLLEEFDIDRKKLLESFEVGQEVSGIVKNITDYGAFCGSWWNRWFIAHNRYILEKDK